VEQEKSGQKKFTNGMNHPDLRLFNQLLIEKDKVIKKPLDAQEERLAKLQLN
jgi:hypothetical protein